MAKLPQTLSNFVFENITPCVNSGEFPVKREPMDFVDVTAHVYRHGHEKMEANLLSRKKGTGRWKRTPMTAEGNDVWSASFQVTQIGFYEFCIEAITIHPRDKGTLSQVYEVRVDPIYARFSSWYEMFPRSQGTNPNASATWDDCIARLGDISNMGFDTIYVVPIHPIGETNRKGKNNSLKAKPGEPGCPYAVGNQHGGHYAVDPELGGMEGFDRFAMSCRKMGFRMVLDIALNCSPDHPHVKDHPDWYFREPDGTIKFAENPPKKYEDIYPYNFHCEDWKSLWQEIRDMIVFWADKGFTTFRIDNPHTKPYELWQWLIQDIKETRPELVFLAEAFTRPKIMNRLAKLGFDQSYTYFTWREQKWELEAYFKELCQGPAKEYMRGVLFPTTPDILPKHLQNAPREAFILRLFLAGTLSSVYGMYNGYELCENEPYPGKEELINSEKYQYKTRDWNAPGNIKDFVRKLNDFRNRNSAAWEYDNLYFHHIDNDQIMAYSKRDPKNGNTVLYVVNLDIHNVQSGFLHLNLAELGLREGQNYMVQDFLSKEVYLWSHSTNYVSLDPRKAPGHLFLVKPGV
jgi:starch synthase (maltosyl-transferring)